MARLVFTRAPIGTVVQLPDGVRTATVGLVKVHPKNNQFDVVGSFFNQKSIVTSWSFNENVNVQFTHTMGNDIYLNVFGNRMGTFTVNGLAFHAAGCEFSRHGIARIIEWYRRNRISNPGANRIRMTIGGSETIEGFLIGASYRANDPVNWTVEYTMQIAAVPN